MSTIIDSIFDSDNNGYILYILSLRNNKYYVGITTNLENRLEAHRRLEGSTWTKLHKVNSLVGYKHITSNQFDAKLIEDTIVKKMMMIYGIDNVRGGTYSHCILNSVEIDTINKELLHAKNKCFKCGGIDHYSSQCYKRQLSCKRCGRKNHKTSDCYATTDIDGEYI